MKLTTQYLNPIVLRCAHFDGYRFPSKAKMGSRIVYDYEIELYLRSGGGIEIDGRFVPFQAGDVNIRKPGQQVKGVLPYECTPRCIDFFGNYERSKGYLFGCEEEAQPVYENPLLLRLPDKLTPSNFDVLRHVMAKICQDSVKSDDLHCFSVKSNLYFLLNELFHDSSLTCASSRGNRHISKAVDYIMQHFSEDLDVEELIRRSGLSKAYFHSCFKNMTGTTPGKMLASLRLDKAKNLLCITRSPVGEIAAACGFTDHVYFSSAFKKHTGLTPTEYRECQLRAGGRERTAWSS